MKVNAKKIMILVSMVLLLVATGCLNYFLGQKTSVPGGGTDDPVVTLDFFEAYRQDREANRNQEILYLDNIIASEVSSTDAVESAETKRMELVTLMEKELVLEGLIKARGYDDCVVTMSDSGVNVVVKSASELDDNSATQIMSLIVKETGVKGSEVFIIPYV